MEFIEGFEDCGGDDEAREPLAVCGNDVPWGMLGGGLLNHLLVRFLIVLPEAALLHVGHGELPIFLSIFEALEKAPLLLFLGELKEELADDDAVTRELELAVV